MIITPCKRKKSGISMMNIFIVTGIVAMLILSSFVGFVGSVGIEPVNKDKAGNSSILNFEFSFSPPTITHEEQDIIIVSIEDLDLYFKPGEPMLPIKTVNILLPANEKVKNIIVDPGEGVVLPGNYTIKHGQQPYPLSFKGNITPTKPDEKIYNSSNMFPGKFYTVVATNGLCGYNILTLNLYPIQYIPKNGEIIVHPKLILEVNSCQSTSKSKDLACRDLSRDIERVQKLVENPKTVKTYNTGGGRRETRGNTKGGLVDPADTYSYVIITNETLRDTTGDYTFQTLIQSKIDKGLSSTIVTVEDIQGCSDYWWNGLYGDGEPRFNDTACHIRNFIKDAYENWETEYVLLGGDGDGADVGGESGDNIIPAREFYATLLMGLGEFIASDLYYAALDGTWNNEENPCPLDKDLTITDIGVNGSGEGFLGDPVVDTTDYLIGSDSILWTCNNNNSINGMCNLNIDLPYLNLSGKNWLNFNIKVSNNNYHLSNIILRDSNDSELLYLPWDSPFVIHGLNSDTWETEHIYLKDLEGSDNFNWTAVQNISIEVKNSYRQIGDTVRLDGVYFSDFIDEYWGEPGEDDLLAEVFVGRAPIDSEEELSNFVRKTLAYENSSGEQYLRDVWMIGEYLGFGGIADWGGNYKDEIKDGCDKHGYTTTGISPDYDVYTMYDRDRYMEEEHINISSYVGNNNVRIRYRLTADEYTCLAGLYIDDFKVTGDTLQLFFDDMEQGINGWTHYGYADKWKLGTPVYSRGVLKAHSGINCWGTGLDSTYNNNCNQSLISPPINLTGITSSAELTFYVWYDIERDYDYGYVEISTDGGDTWDIIKNYTGRSWWDKEDLTSIINENDVHIINHLGHGNSFHVMKLDEPVKMKSGVIYGPCHDVENLTNENYFFAYSQACFPGAFDNMDYNWNYQPYDSIVEYLVTDDHGAFAFIANTRSGIGYSDTNAPSQHFDRGFFDVLYNESIRNLGWANQRSKEKNIGKIDMDCIRYCYYQITLFGDPEISIKDPPMPEHDIHVHRLDAPDYHLINTTTYVNATIYNRGKNEETDLVVQFLVEDEIVDSALILSLQSKEYYDVSFTWSEDTIGLYNVSVQVLPVPGEDYLINNMKTIQIMVTSSPPVKVVVLDSIGTSFNCGFYALLNRDWRNYGTTPIIVDYTTFKQPYSYVTYDQLVELDPDVIVIPTTMVFVGGHEFSDEEILAIKTYVENGHGLIATGNPFWFDNNIKLLPLFGIQEDVEPFLDTGTTIENFDILFEDLPLFRDIPNPYVPGSNRPCVPRDDYSWDANDLSSGTYVAESGDSKGAIIINKGFVYISTWIEHNPNINDLQFLYNAILWSKYTPPPAAPTGLTALPGDIFVNLHWNANEEDIMYYSIYRSTSLDTGFEKIAQTDGTTTFYQDTERFINTTYYYKITATDSGYSESNFSYTASATPRRPARGDMDNNGYITVGDIIFLINFLFRNGPEPPILAAADVNADGTLEEPKVDLGDVVYLINYLFSNGQPPVYLDWPNHLPYANAGDDQTGYAGCILYFNGSFSYDLDGVIVSYEWDFDDDTSGEGITTTHQYNSKGIYNVTLTVADDRNGTDSDTCIVQVLSPIINVPEDYSTIQDAINNATDGQTIFVAPGIYVENIDFLGKAITVKSTNGSEVTIIDGNRSGSVVTFNSGETSTSILEGFTITNGSKNNGWGINCISSSPTIKNNIITQDDFFAKEGFGIYLIGSSNNTISRNTITNYYCGIYIEESFNDTLSENTITNNYWGIYLGKSSNNTISDNNITYNDHDGIRLSGSSNNIISGNIIKNHSFSLELDKSYNNKINNNIIKNNKQIGIVLWYLSCNNQVYHNNFIDNDQNVRDDETNIWDNDYPSGGNYWSDFDEPHEGAYDNFSGPNQDINGSDGIVDTPYNITHDDSIQDRYPLFIPLSDEIAPVILDVNATLTFQLHERYLNITCTAIDNTIVDKVNVTITGPPGFTSINITMSRIADTDNYYYESSYTTIGVYDYYIWAVDKCGNTAMSEVQHFEIPPQPIIDYILITKNPDGDEIRDKTIGTEHIITGHASAYNHTFDYIGLITVNWSVENLGSDASTDPLTGTSSTFNSGTKNNTTAIWKADDGNGHNDTVVFTIKNVPIYVDDNAYPGWYDDTHLNSISEALDIVAEGQTIFVYNGTYYENVVIDKTINLIGQDKESTIIDGNRNGDVVIISANEVNITGFTIQNSGTYEMYEEYDAGIKMCCSDYNTIYGNIITKNCYGIGLLGSSHNNITENTITDNFRKGIDLRESSNKNIISGNNITKNGYNSIGVYLKSSSNNNIISGNSITDNADGIYLYFSFNNSISNNFITNRFQGIVLSESSNNSMFGNHLVDNWCGFNIEASSNNSMFGNNLVNNEIYGFDIWFSSNNTVTENTITDNRDFGIYLSDATNNVISFNAITNSDVAGICLLSSSCNIISQNNITNDNDDSDGICLSYSSTNNKISENTITQNKGGIHLKHGSSDNTISENNIIDNDGYGINISDSSNNTIYHNNFINNTENAIDYGSNIWDNDYPSGGNYWDDFDEPGEGAYDNFSGPEQNISGSDGIVDLGPPTGGLNPYDKMGGDNQDMYPLMFPHILDAAPPLIFHNIHRTS